MSARALFLDRDGVINVDHGYVHRPDQVEFVPGIFELVAAATSRHWPVVVVTNQSGIGRGYYGDSDFRQLTDWMRERFAERGGRIEAVYHCPHHPHDAQPDYRRACPDRKPEPGMLLRARDDLDLDLPGSVLVGDRASDLEAARRAGVGARLLFDPSGAEPLPTEDGDIRIRTLPEAIAWLD
ncbi:MULTISPECIES: D-glycero-beta-D-manno-heptose 1,7-bisphosphate 7-phosphatase [unclassified Thioalkalivibrio]|uniref:D-glycero-alpha-D-manno-heptose-1,7-bisphosphate 7-phosphatase n=1 Tax=unclassified Thioalkalivibrio TaxID=2621013 RepID=UPI00036D9FEC|nr:MULTISPECIES: HAD family hydrolase [unclassified Thioalkalivibrio]